MLSADCHAAAVADAGGTLEVEFRGAGEAGCSSRTKARQAGRSAEKAETTEIVVATRTRNVATGVELQVAAQTRDTSLVASTRAGVAGRGTFRAVEGSVVVVSRRTATQTVALVKVAIRRRSVAARADSDACRAGEARELTAQARRANEERRRKQAADAGRWRGAHGAGWETLHAG